MGARSRSKAEAPTKSRANYSATELKLIDACLKNGRSLRQLASELHRDYTALWRFAKQRGGTSGRAARQEDQQRIDKRIHDVFNKLFRERKKRSVTAMEVARGANAAEKRVRKVLGAKLLHADAVEMCG